MGTNCLFSKMSNAEGGLLLMEHSGMTFPTLFWLWMLNAVPMFVKEMEVDHFRNCKHRWAAAKLAACANSLGLFGPNLAWDSTPVVYAYRLNVTWIGILCRRCMAKMPKYCNFDQIFTFWAPQCPSPFTDSGQIRQETVDPWSMLTRHCITFQGQKKCNFGLLLIFEGLLYPANLPIRPNFWYASLDPSSMHMCQISSWSDNSVALGCSQILPFFGHWRFVVSPSGSVWKKLNADAQLQTFHYLTVSKSFPYSNAFKAKSCTRILSFTGPSFTSVTSQAWWTNKPTDKKLNVIQAPQNLACW